MMALLVKLPKGMHIYDFRLNSYRKLNSLRFSNINALGIKYHLAVIKGQDQPRFTICANLVGHTSHYICIPTPKAIGLLDLEKMS